MIPMSQPSAHAMAWPAIRDNALRRVRSAHATRRPTVFELRLPDLDGPSAFAHFVGDATLWTSKDGSQGVGFGSAETLTASGRGRFHEIGIRASALFERYDLSATSSPVRLYAAFSFAPSLNSPRWAGFHAAEATLPMAAAEHTANGARLRVAVRPDIPVETILDTVRRALDALEAGAPTSAPAAAIVSRRGGDGYQARVVDCLHRIRAGEARKIVAARRLDLSYDSAPAAHVAIQALHDAHQNCFRFAFRRGDAVFLGASPESLVRLHDQTVETVALAGSAAPSATGEATLKGSAKDASEHGMVVEHVREALQPFCDRLNIANAPRVRRLPHIVHLETPVEGALGAPVNVLRLAAQLHPTPAVCGVPTVAASAWINDVEAADRGLYAGPLGWFDARGNGELAVAIRSGLVRGSEASVWAGAGIVEASDPASEDAETLQKLQPMLQALGVPA